MADTPVDTLIIDIETKASNADKAIDKFSNAIGNLVNSLARVDTGKLNSIGNGIQRLSSSMQTMKSIDTRSINSVVNKINSLSAIDTSKFATVSANLHQMANGIQSLGTVSENVASVGELAKNISKLGNKSVQTAVTNIPQLATALNGLMNTLSHAPKVSQNLIDMTNALANLTAQGSRVGSASNSIVKGLNRASSSATRANKSFKGLASTLGKFYANCFLMIRGLKGLWNSINSTADYLEAFNYFEVALNKVGGDWASRFEQYGYASAEEYANSFKTRLNESLKGLSGVQISIDANGKTGLLTDTGMKNLGLNIQEVTQYASQLASVTNSVGQTGEVTLATASAFTKLGADMSSLFNVDYSSVMNNLQSGLIGQSRALYKYGIDTTNATLQTYAYELGVEKAVSEMTQAEKMQLRMIAILDQSKVAWGDQSNTINSLSNSIRQFKNNIKEAGMILGQLFVPILSKIMPIVNGLVIAIKRLMVSVAGLFGIKLDLSEFGQSTSNVTDEMGGLSDSLDDATSSAEKLKKATTTLGIDELNINSPQTDTSSGASGGASGGGIDLTDSILKATEEYEKAWQEAYDRMQNKAEAFADKIEKALEPVKKIFQDFAVGDFFQAGQDVSNLVVSITDFFSRAIDSVDWYGIGTKIGDFIAGINWFDVLGSIGGLIWQAIKASIELATGIYDAAPIETSIIAGIALLKWTGLGSAIFKGVSKSILSGTLFKDLGTLLSGGLLEKSGITAKIADVFALTFGGAGSLSESFEAIFGTIGAKIAGIGTIIAGVTTAVSNFFSMWRTGFDWFKEALMLVGISLTAVGAVILGAPALVAGVVAAVVSAIATVVIVIHDNWDEITGFTSEMIENVKGFFTPLVDFISRNITEPITKRWEQFKDGISIIIKGIQIVWNTVWNAIKNFIYNSFIVPVQNRIQLFKTFVSSVFNALKTVVSSVWNATPVQKFVTKVQKALGKLKSFVVGIFGAISNAAKFFGNILIGSVESMINLPINALNTFLKGFNNIVGHIASITGDNWTGVDLFQTVAIPRFETGGFPQRYSLFMAGENGIPEIAGTVGGKTAVAGGAEITGISNAVYSTSEEELRELREMNSLLRQLLNKDTTVNIGDREIYKASVRGSRSYGKLLLT